MTDHAVKIWKLNDCDYVAAATLAEAERLLCDMMEGKDEPVTDAFREWYIDEPAEMTDMEMETMTVYEKEFGEEGFEESKVTFRQSLDKMIADGTKFPTHFCSTDY